MILKNFDYVYKDENEEKQIASLSHVRIEPVFEFSIIVDRKVYNCLVERIMSEEWKLELCCVSNNVNSNNDYYFTELSFLDDVLWNTESIYEQINNYKVSSAISHGLADIYHRFRGSY